MILCGALWVGMFLVISQLQRSLQKICFALCIALSCAYEQKHHSFLLVISH